MFLLKKGNTLRTAPSKKDADIALSKGNTAGGMSAQDSLKLILDTLEESKAENTVPIDIAGKSALGDYMVVTSGRSSRHVSAICDEVIKNLKNSGLGNARVEGLSAGDWVLIDSGDVIVHVFRPEIRDFYNLEEMWLAPSGQDGPLH